MSTRAKRYDSEGGTSWHAVFSDSKHVLPTKDTRYMTEEIPVRQAEIVAKMNGYDTFEIVRTTTEITRYQITEEVTHESEV